MNFLFFTEYFPDPSEPIFTGGVETRVYRLASFLRDHGHGVEVKKRTETYSFNTPKTLIDRFLYFWRSLIGVEGKNYDIVEGTNFVTYIPAFFRAKWIGARSVAWYPDVFVGHAIERLGFINGMITEIAEWIALHLPWDGVIALSNETRKKLIAVGVSAKKIRVIYGGVDLPKSPKSPKSPQQILLCIARLVQYKRVQDLLLAAYVLKEKFPQIRIIIVGDGPERNALRQLSVQLGISSLILWKRHITEDEKWELLKKSTLHILPSVVEGFGLVTVEALAVGTPVINADTPVNREILEKPQATRPQRLRVALAGEASDKLQIEGGLLFRAGDYVDLAEKIETLLIDKKLYNQKVSEGKELVKRYEWEKVNTQTERFYQHLLSH